MSNGQNRNKFRFRIRYDNCDEAFETDSSEVLIGRDPDATLRIDTVGVSRRHAVIWVEHEVIYLKDLGSSNGTFLNGVELEPLKPVVISGKDTHFMVSEFVQVSVSYGGANEAIELESPRAEIPAVMPAGQAGEPGAGLNVERKRLSERVESLKQEIVVLKAEKIQLERDSANERKALEAALLSLQVNKADLEKAVLRREEEVKEKIHLIDEKLESATKAHEARLASFARELEAHKKSYMTAEAELAQRRETAVKAAEELQIESERLQKHYRSSKEVLTAQNAALKQEATRLEAQLAELKVMQVELIREADAATEEAAKSVAEAAEKVRWAKEEQENARAETDSLRNEAAHLKEAIPDIQRSMNELRREQEQLIAGVEADKRTLLQELSARKELADKQREEIDSELGKITSDLEAKKKECQQQSELMELESRKYRANFEILDAELRTKRSQVEAEIEEKKLELAKQRRELDAASQASGKGWQEAKEAEQRVVALKSELESWQLQIDQLRVVKEALDQEVASTRASLEDVRAEKESVGTEAKQLREAAERELESFRAEAEASLAQESRRRSKELDEQFSVKATEMEREVAEAKLRKISELESMAKERADRESARRHLLAREIVRRSVDLAQKGQLEDHESEFQQLIVDMMDGKSTGAWSLEAVYRTRRFWRKMAQMAAVPVTLVALLYFFPWIPLILVDNVSRKIASEKIDNGAFYEQIRAKGMKFQPPTDRVFRQSYRDNLLYLDGYSDMKFDEMEKSKWILLLNDFLVGRLGLSDRIVPNFVSAESLMLRDLMQIREGMLPQYKENGFARLAEAEKKGREALVGILQNEQNYAKFRALEKSFYEDYLARKERK